jgi:hypothetical protein
LADGLLVIFDDADKRAQINSTFEVRKILRVSRLQILFGILQG